VQVGIVGPRASPMGVDFLISCGSGRVNWGRGKAIGCSENRGGLILAKLRWS
jgi:hypothetical protein